MQAIKWQDEKLILLDQTKLPNEISFIHCNDYKTVGEAIKRLAVRGAPAIGVAAAFALVLGAKQINQETRDTDVFWSNLESIAEYLRGTRPTAVNLFWAIDRMLKVKKRNINIVNEIVEQLLCEAKDIAASDESINKQISKLGAELFKGSKIAVLTHCNAGALATYAQGTALGVIREAYQNGSITKVYADETRPLLQGARLTAWELMQESIPVTLITDNMAGWVMKQGLVQAVIVGADRIALNGDTANKIGTYSVAVLAKEHNIPFYVAAPLSTFDFSIKAGDEIPIEERCKDEVRKTGKIYTAPRDVDVFNPAFDVTPNKLITAIITEKKVLKPPFNIEINKLAQEEHIK